MNLAGSMNLHLKKSLEVSILIVHFVCTPLVKCNGTFFLIEHLISLKIFDFHQIWWVTYTGIYKPVCQIS